MSGGRRFELLQELGSGSFGTVYLAEMISAGDFRKRVALKVLNPEVEGVGDAGVRLRDEARLLGRLRHRNIVRVEDLVRLEDRWAVVMEHVSGHDLAAVSAAAEAAGEPVPVRAAVAICAEIAAALAFAYDGRLDGGEPLRVVHRDVKPHNVRLTGEGEVVVLDFGVARAEFSSREAQTGIYRMGSVAYMAPERLMGEPEGPPGDVYALGCVLYELLAGRALGRPQLQPDSQGARVDEALAALAARRELPPLLLALLRRMLAFAPGDRPDADELAGALSWLGQDLPGEPLRAYARRFVPRIAELTRARPRPASGTLVETSYRSAPAEPPPTDRRPAVGRSSTDTWIFDVGSGPAAAAPDPAVAPDPIVERATSPTLALGRSRPAVRPSMVIGLLLLAAVAAGWIASRELGGRLPDPIAARSELVGTWIGDEVILELSGPDAALTGVLHRGELARAVRGRFDPDTGALELLDDRGGRCDLNLSLDRQKLSGRYGIGGEELPLIVRRRE